MKKRPCAKKLAIGVCILTLLLAVMASAQDAPESRLVKEDAFQLSLPAGWTKTSTSLPQGMDVGFTKSLPGGGTASLYLHHEIMPAEAGEPPSDTSDMQAQWNSLIRQQYGDVTTIAGSAPNVQGRILINATYGLTDGGDKVTRRYTYFLSGRTAFVVQCTASPESWASVLGQFDSMLASMSPGGKTTGDAIDDAAALSDMRQKLPTLARSFPQEWSCVVSGFKIAAVSGKRTLDLSLAFDRRDIATIYRATKLGFAVMKEKGGDGNLGEVPSDLQSAVQQSAPFVQYVGQIWGMAFGSVANCKQPIDAFRVAILDSNKQTVGRVAISRQDAVSILTGKVTPDDTKKVATMYVFE